MSSTPPARVAPTPESLVVQRALEGHRVRRYHVVGASDRMTRDLIASLTSLGWHRSDGHEAEAVVIVSGDAADVTAGAALAAPILILAGTLSASTWPSWHPVATDAGYVGCQRTEGWTIYVHSARATELGPALSYAATDRERFPDGLATDSRDELVEELIYWRTAAVSRWATRAAEQPERTNKEMEHEITHLKGLLEATQRTLSWRITAPLRQVQSARLRGGRR